MRDAGFTLVETLVAFTVLALALGATLPAIATALSQGRAASEASARALEARSLMEAVGVAGPLAEGERRGRLSSGEPWRLALTRLDPQPSPGRTPPAAAGAQVPVTAYRVDLVVGEADRPTLALSTVKLSWPR
ncbi:MAG: type II secretion system protein [Paracoccaceae bacterium]